MKVLGTFNGQTIINSTSFYLMIPMNLNKFAKDYSDKKMKIINKYRDDDKQR